MENIAIDLHRRRSYIHACDDQGVKIFAGRIDNSCENFRKILSEFDPEDTRICVEATYGWEWLADLLEDEGFDLKLAHPLRTKAIASARVKTDAVDAKTLAHLLRSDLLPEAYIAPRPLRDLRQILRQRISLVAVRTSLKNRVHAYLASYGIQHDHTDLFGRAGTLFLKGLDLRKPERDRIETLLRLIGDLNREIELIDQQVKREACETKEVSVLTRIPGIGPYTALLVIAEVGDVSRFRSPRKLTSWAGLTPKTRSSDAKVRTGHISRQGSPALRWAMVEAAQKAERSGGHLREMFERIAKRRGRKIARVAVAREILELCYYGLRDGEIRRLRGGEEKDSGRDSAAKVGKAA